MVNQSRKKHVVNGNVSDVKKSDKSLDLNQNHRKESSVFDFFKLLSKKKDK